MELPFFQFEGQTYRPGQLKAEHGYRENRDELFRGGDAPETWTFASHLRAAFIIFGEGGTPDLYLGAASPMPPHIQLRLRQLKLDALVPSVRGVKAIREDIAHILAGQEINQDYLKLKHRAYDRLILYEDIAQQPTHMSEWSV